MQFKRISTRIMVSILPVVFVSTIALTVTSYAMFSRSINHETQEKMFAFLENESLSIERELNLNASIIRSLASYVKNNDSDALARGEHLPYQISLIASNDYTLGGGIWLEPWLLGGDRQFFGSYVQRQGDAVCHVDAYEHAAYNYSQTDWYLNGKSGGGDLVWSDAYVDPVSGLVILTGSQAIYDEGGKFMGIVTADVEAAVLGEIVGRIKVGETGRAFIASADGGYVVFDGERAGEMILAEDVAPELERLGQAFLAGEGGESHMMLQGVPSRVYFKTIPQTGWKLGIVIDEAEVMGVGRRMTLIMLGITALTLGVISLFVVWLANYLRGIISRVNDFSHHAAQGSLEERLHLEVQDEFRSIADNLNTMMDGMQAMNNTNLSMLQDSRELVSEITRSSHQVSGNSRRIVDAADQLARGSAEQAATIQNLSATGTRILTLASENAQKAEAAADLANAIRGAAERGDGDMERMMQAVRQIAGAAQDISGIVGAMDSIAFQTRILAINAAVEAARAGEHGRGFAVVSQEVRGLAQKSAEEAGGIVSIIDRTLEKINLGLQLADQAAASFREIAQGIVHSAEIVGSISEANRKQADEVEAVTGQIDLILEATRDNAQFAEDSTHAAQAMHRQAEVLYGLVARHSHGDAVQQPLEELPAAAPA